MFYFITWNRNILFRTWNIPLLWIFIFSYTTYLVEKLLFYALHKEFKKRTKIYSSKYVVYEKINIHNNKIFHISYAILQKNYWGYVQKRAINVTNREILQSLHISLTKFIDINFSNVLSLICMKIPSTGATSKTLTCYI